MTIQETNNPSVTHIIYFDLPDCEQISFHNDFTSDEEKRYPVYIDEWDGKINSTLPKLQDAILKRYSTEIKAKKTNLNKSRAAAQMRKLNEIKRKEKEAERLNALNEKKKILLDINSLNNQENNFNRVKKNAALKTVNKANERIKVIFRDNGCFKHRITSKRFDIFFNENNKITYTLYNSNTDESYIGEQYVYISNILYLDGTFLNKHSEDYISKIDNRISDAKEVQINIEALIKEQVPSYQIYVRPDKLGIHINTKTGERVTVICVKDTKIPALNLKSYTKKERRNLYCHPVPIRYIQLSSFDD